MKHTKAQIESMSNRSSSHADALATLYEMIMAEVEERARMPRVRRKRIRFAVDRTMSESWGLINQETAEAGAEAALAALGCTIVDDDTETSEKPELVVYESRDGDYSGGFDKPMDNSSYGFSLSATEKCNPEPEEHLTQDEVDSLLSADPSLEAWKQQQREHITGQSERLRSLIQARELIDQMISAEGGK